MFSVPTYIVLDLPAAIGAEVVSFRARFDAYTAALPPEITVAGSSGIGTLAEGQDPECVFKALERIAQAHLPFASSFVSIERFPGTHIFWLKPRERKPFDDLQASLLEVGILFLGNPFPFNPHCTISSNDLLTAAQINDLLNTTVPRQEFLLSRLCVYHLIDGRASLLREFSFLGGPRNASPF
jgi:2'-5' RNA ligase